MAKKSLRFSNNQYNDPLANAEEIGSTELMPWNDQRISDLGYKMWPIPGWMCVFKGRPPKHGAAMVQQMFQRRKSIKEYLEIAENDFKIFVHPRKTYLREILYETLGILTSEENVGMKYCTGEIIPPEKVKIVVYAEGKESFESLLLKVERGLKSSQSKAEIRAAPRFCSKSNQLVYYRQGDAWLREVLCKGEETLAQYFTGENHSLFI